MARKTDGQLVTEWSPTVYTVGMRRAGAVMSLVAMLAIWAALGSAQGSNRMSNKAAIATTYPDTVDGLRHFLETYLQTIKTGDLEKRKLMEKSLQLPNPKKWFTKVYGPTFGPKVEKDYGPELSPYFEYRDLGPSLKIDISRVQLSARQAEQSDIRSFDRWCTPFLTTQFVFRGAATITSM